MSAQRVLKRVRQRKWNSVYRQRGLERLERVEAELGRVAIGDSEGGSSEKYRRLCSERDVLRCRMNLTAIRSVNDPDSTSSDEEPPASNESSSGTRDTDSEDMQTSDSGEDERESTPALSDSSSSSNSALLAPDAQDPDLWPQVENVGHGHHKKRETLLDLRRTSRTELSTLLLAVKVKESLPETCSMLLRAVMNTLIVDPHSLLEDTYTSHKEFLRNMCPIPRDWVVYCPQCTKVCSRRRIEPSKERVRARNVDHPTCEDCDLILVPQLVQQEQCKFILCSLTAQIESFLRRKALPLLLERTKAFPRATVRGEMHDELQFPDFLDMSIAVDAAPLTKRSVSLLPCFFFFNNIPCNYQHKFIVLGGVFTGTSKKTPHAQVFFSEIKKEMDELAGKGVTWVTPSGVTQNTKIIVTLSLGDGKQRSEMLNLNAANGRYSCPWCYEKGSDIGGGHYRYFRLLHSTHKDPDEALAPWRSEADYLELAKQAAEIVSEGRALDIVETLGVKGYPVFFYMKNFDAVWSTTPDSLHVVHEGITKRMLDYICKSSGKRSSLRRTGENFDGECLLHFEMERIF
jgi:hypothetical protein